MRYLILFSMGILIVAGCLFPATRHLRSIGMETGEFTLERPGRIYGALELREYLPDESLFFVEYGVDSCLVAQYAREQEHYRADLFLFNDPKGSAGQYVFSKRVSQTAIDIGYQGRIVGNMIEVLKGHYIIRIHPERGGTQVGAIGLAKVLAARIEGGAIKADIFETLPQENLIADSELYFKGPRAFRERYGNELVSALEIQYMLEGTVAKYEVDRHQLELFVLKYPNRESVLSAIDTYIAAHPGNPALYGDQGVTYTTVVHEHQRETYLAEWGDTLYLMRGGRSTDRSSEFFEYILRGGR